MDKTISAADANRKFSQILQKVREGTSYVVTSHGKPVARIVPAEEALEAQREAREKLLVRLRSQPALNAGPWTRDELYDE